MRHDQAMSIDPVAVYAAVVATAALGWQVYQWRSERRGKLRLDVWAHWWRGTDEDDEAWMVWGTIVNRNDYPVGLRRIGLVTTPSKKDSRRRLGPTKSPEELGLPDEIPARSSAHFEWEKTDLERKLHGMSFRPGDTLKLTVVNSLYELSSASAQVLDRSGVFPRLHRG
jgi:hypothetical protein